MKNTLKIKELDLGKIGIGKKLTDGHKMLNSFDEPRTIEKKVEISYGSRVIGRRTVKKLYFGPGDQK